MVTTIKIKLLMVKWTSEIHSCGYIHKPGINKMTMLIIILNVSKVREFEFVSQLFQVFQIISVIHVMHQKLV